MKSLHNPLCYLRIRKGDFKITACWYIEIFPYGITYELRCLAQRRSACMQPFMIKVAGGKVTWKICRDHCAIIWTRFLMKNFLPIWSLDRITIVSFTREPFYFSIPIPLDFLLFPYIPLLYLSSCLVVPQKKTQESSCQTLFKFTIYFKIYFHHLLWGKASLFVYYIHTSI